MNLQSARLTVVFLFFTCSAFSQIQFIENKGQWEKTVAFKTDIQTGAFFLQKTGFTVLMHDPSDMKKISDYAHGDDTVTKDNSTAPDISPLQLRSHAYKVSFSGASQNTTVVPDKVLPGVNNYFLGDDAAKWQSNCKTFESVVYKNMYPNIDVHYYASGGKLKYDIIIHPGGKISDIAMQYQGADQLTVKNKELIIGTSVGEVKEADPYTYIVNNGKRSTISCIYVIANNEVTFKADQTDPSATIVIDPTLIFSSFTGSTKDNWGYAGTPGPDGSFFAGGICFGSGFPVSLGAFQQTFNGGIDEDRNGPYDMAIFKFSANGSSRLYATYLGGSGNEQPQSMICDAQGNLIVASRTNSLNFPVTIPMIGAGGGYDIAVTKFNSTGTALTGSVKIGGSQDDGVNIKPKYVALGVPGQSDGAYETRRNYGDDARCEVIQDALNNIYLVACTQSANFPVTNNVMQSIYAGGRQDGLILKFPSSLASVTFSTFFGGEGSDACFNAFINPVNNNLYVSGATTSTNLPGNKANVVSSTYNGGATDGFVTQVTADGTAIVRTTYVGTAGNDMIYGLEIDDSGSPYIMGTTTGNFPVINSVFSNVGSKQFIAKLQPDLSGYQYSTIFGTVSDIPNISPTAFHLDKCQNVYVAGWGGSFNNNRGYPCAGTLGMTTTANAIQSTTDGKDFYFFVLQRDAASQLFGSFFGQNGGFDDHVDGGTSRFDKNGILYQAECANCGGGVFFPTTPGVWATSNASANCSEAAIKIDMNFENAVAAGIKATFNGTGIEQGVCVLPATITFTDTVSKGKLYVWNFGDGTPAVTTVSPVNFKSHTYTASGIFRAKVITIDSASCNITDSSFLFAKINNCNSSCPLSTTSYTSNLTGAVYQWQVNIGTGFTDILNDANFSGAATKQLQLNNAPASWYGHEYRCLIDSSSYSNVFTLRFVNNWLGSVSTSWEDPLNWSCGIVPDRYTDAVINTGTIVLNSNTSVASMTITPGAGLVVNPPYILTITGH